jgi:hydrogenase maturation protease
MFAPSTHAFGINEALEMARQLDRLPGRVVVYGVEGGSFSTGLGLTPEVEAAAEVVVGQVLAELRDWLG